ncbi:PLP-dependent aminotransferase family protein [Yokenella regensburgei]|uniref:MocR-like pyridoxine biosynthesis transcription factor PdxR n=1 Tax=Yokenella regensburgei TaxID=158877 RepID=UPI001375D541|nr:PLP-dependent aminotransferase family protein [Yokenella regensburgei]KAF1369540.1 GntR family transcriptional regulator/MocR family aminotransferase [Yokenella regensburgei]
MRSLVCDLLQLRLDEQPEGKLHKRLYNAIRLSILDGSLLPQSRLPPSRDLATQLRHSRNTVLTVYEQLLAEGYIVSRSGSGTFVARTVPDSLLFTAETASETRHDVRAISLSHRGEALLAHSSASPRQWGAFLPGVPDVGEFPHALLRKIHNRVSRKPQAMQFSYSPFGGSCDLQQALMEYLRVARSVRCTPEQILITEGIHQAIDLVSRMLCNPGDTAWIEEPAYWGIRNVLQMNGVALQPIDVDLSGMDPPEEIHTPPRLIFVTPSHQYPLGCVMSMERRRRLLAIARQTGGWIVEDDYDSEFRFSGQPIPALQGLIDDAPVIYTGTFSKTMWPGLRLGYVVLPQALAQTLKTAHAELYRSGRLLDQAALAQFIREGHYTAHIRRMRLLYARRRQRLTTLITQYLGKAALSEFNDNAGLHLVLKLEDHHDDIAIARNANEKGVLVRPLSRYYMGGKPQRGLLMGFAAMKEEEMEGAFKVLLGCITKKDINK